MSLRDQMPETARFVDAMREAFGVDVINEAIRRGIKGEADCFFAREGGHTVGTPFRQPELEVRWRKREWFDA